MTLQCCWIHPETHQRCAAEAEWVILNNSILAPAEGFTEACGTHVGDLLTDNVEHSVYPAGWDASPNYQVSQPQ